MEILTPGEKVKKLRKELKLSQEDIACMQVSKSLISMIEKNKRNLTRKVANIIANNLNKYYIRIGRKIIPDELMETELDRVRKGLYYEISLLKESVEKNNINIKLFDVEFGNLMNTTINWNLKKLRMELLLLKGEFYYKSYQYKTAIKDLAEPLNYYIEERDYEQVAYIYNLMGNGYHMLLMVDQALIYYNKAYETAVENNVTTKIRVHEIMISIILSYRKLKKYDMALHYIAVFNRLEANQTIETEEIIACQILEANTYRDLKKFQRAERIYSKALQKVDVMSNRLLVKLYDNLSILHLKMDDIDGAIHYLNKASQLKGDCKPSYMLGVILTKANCERVLGNTNKGLNILKEGLKIAEKASMMEMIIDYHFVLVELYIIQKEYDEALKYLKAVDRLIFKNDIRLRVDELYSFYGQLYCLLGEDKKAIDYMIMIRQDYLDQKQK